MNCQMIIRNARVLDGSGDDGEVLDVAVADGRIVDVGPNLRVIATEQIDGEGLVLAPGFIDTHTHDDTSVIETPQMLPKVSQGVTTVVVGNCGISAAPVRLKGAPPEPMNLLGGAEYFRYPTFARYVEALGEARPAVNVAALAGHTAIRNNHMDRLDREATDGEIAAMRADLQESLDAGAIGLSTGLAYANANAATTNEVNALAELLHVSGGVYATHMRTEAAAVLEAMEEAFAVGKSACAPVVISHLKCAGVDNWGRSGEVLEALDAARAQQAVGADCYPYAAGSTTLDLKQVDERVEITITWCTRYPELAGRSLKQIAGEWGVPQMEAARRLQPAGAIYHSIAESDMRRILAHPATMVGSDGLPHDAHPHPRLWGTFPRVLGKYCREEKLFSLAEAVHKMTGMPAQRFGLDGRGLIRPGYAADLVLFDENAVIDMATFAEPVLAAKGIERVWVNSELTYAAGRATGARAGQFLRRVGGFRKA